MNFAPYPSIGDARLSNGNGNDASASVGNSVWSSSTVISGSEEKLYVAVDKKFEEGQSVLSWALRNSGGRKICLLHVHQPAKVAQEVNYMGGRFPANVQKEQAKGRKKQAEGRERMLQLLNKYLLVCSRAGVPAEKLQIETKKVIEEEILKLISQYGIRWLVMGAASRTHYSRKMTHLKSKKAKYVNAEAPATCHIWFVCKDQLIYTREESLGVTNVDPGPKVKQPGPYPGTIRPDPVIARSVTLGPSTQRNQISSSHNHYGAMSMNLHGRTVSEIYTGDGRGASTSNSTRHSEASLEEDSGASLIHLSQASHLPTCSSSDVDSSVALTPYVSAEGTRESQYAFDYEDPCQAPHYFICPIFQEVMQNPHVAADGFTYEAEALKGWFDSGHDTSPMTNLRLINKIIIPNLALRSAIQEWLQKQKRRFAGRSPGFARAK